MVDNVYDDDGNLDTSIDYKYQWKLVLDEESSDCVDDCDSDTGTLRVMLNTDMELVYDIDVDNFGDGTDCSVVVGGVTSRGRGKDGRGKDTTDDTACSISDTASLVQTYADVNITFIYCPLQFMYPYY